MTRRIQDLCTPALLLDLDVFEANLARLTDTLAPTGCGFRPHVKTHKCPEIARRQRQAGALGVSAATVDEAAGMVAAGIGGVHVTSPVVTPEKLSRLVAMTKTAPDLMMVVDHADGAAALDAAARAAGVTLNVLVDLDVGDCRTGIEPGPPALDLARQVVAAEGLRFRGLQAYAGIASHVVGFDERVEASRSLMGKAVETRRLIERDGIEVEILSGGSTGTYNIDCTIDGVTELQVGSFVFMDVDYMRIGGKFGAVYDDFAPALTVLSAVVSVNRPGQVSIDAGIKSFSTETEFAPQPVGIEGVRYEIFGDEFGMLHLDNPSRPIGLGDKVRFVTPHCDPTVNLYDRLYCTRGDEVVDTWPIIARREA